MENDSFNQNNNSLLFAKCLRMFDFLSICPQNLQKGLILPPIIFT
jgi:hypothetical protein